MIDVRRFEGLGHANHGWLKARHHFSFASYHDPSRMSWGALRVWNDDEIAPQSGFPMHPHHDMEIITYVRDGAITHQDSLGNRGRTEAGDVQVMSAGSGLRHMEWNEEDEPTRIFQIWILPSRSGGAPRWDARAFPKAGRSDGFQVLASGAPEADGGLMIRQDARVLGAGLGAGARASHDLSASRRAYLVLSSGAATVNGVSLNARDGAAIRDVDRIEVLAGPDGAEAVLVDATA